MAEDKFQWLDMAIRLQAIAQAGLEYCHNDFDRDRYEQIRMISAEILGNHTNFSTQKINGLFSTQTGYPTPKVDVRAVIFKEDNILLVKEKLDGKWSLPGGWADQHLNISENLIKESKEEAGVDVKPEKVLALLDRKKHNYPPIPFGCYKIFVKCDLIKGEFEENTETSDSGFFSLNNLPPLSTERVTEEQIRLCFKNRNIPNLIPFD
jgi:ADP-ribose pyrophosphatase YjhB (NUDIX family)